MYNLILTMKLINNLGNTTISNILKYENKLPKDNIELYDFLSEKLKNNKKIIVPSLEELKRINFSADEIIRKSEDMGVYSIDITDEKYPIDLKKISNKPSILFYKGNFECVLKNKSIAIVGTRNPTEHGKKIAYRLGHIFTQDNYTITSGLALGCDTYAHRGCLDANGTTIAILGTSLDNISPIQNAGLAEEIINKNGCILSEYYIGQKSERYSFVNRNRIQSALSIATIIVETDVNGGTMHTAQYAFNQNKIIGVYNHPNKFHNESSVQGNLDLLKRKGVISLANKDDIDKFRNTLTMGFIGQEMFEI